MGNGSGEHEDKGLGICDPDQLSWSPMLIFQSNSHRHQLQMGLPLSRQLLYDLLGSKDFSGEFHRFTLSVIMTLTYGKRLESKMSREVKAFTQLEHDIAGALAHPMSALGTLSLYLTDCLAGLLRGKGWVILFLILQISS